MRESIVGGGSAEIVNLVRDEEGQPAEVSQSANARHFINDMGIGCAER